MDNRYIILIKIVINKHRNFNKSLNLFHFILFLFIFRIHSVEKKIKILIYYNNNIFLTLNFSFLKKLLNYFQLIFIL